MQLCIFLNDLCIIFTGQKLCCFDSQHVSKQDMIRCTSLRHMCRNPFKSHWLSGVSGAAVDIITVKTGSIPVSCKSRTQAGREEPCSVRFTLIRLGLYNQHWLLPFTSQLSTPCILIAISLLLKLKQLGAKSNTVPCVNLVDATHVCCMLTSRNWGTHLHLPFYCIRSIYSTTAHEFLKMAFKNGTLHGTVYLINVWTRVSKISNKKMLRLCMF